MGKAAMGLGGLLLQVPLAEKLCMASRCPHTSSDTGWSWQLLSLPRKDRHSCLQCCQLKLSRVVFGFGVFFFKALPKWFPKIYLSQ